MEDTIHSLVISFEWYAWFGALVPCGTRVGLIAMMHSVFFQDAKSVAFLNQSTDRPPNILEL